MALVFLSFRTPTTPPNPLTVFLSFGATGGTAQNANFNTTATLDPLSASFSLSAVPVSHLTISETLPSLSASAVFHVPPPAALTIMATCGSPSAMVELKYDLNLGAGRTVSSVGCSWQDGLTLPPRTTHSRHQVAIPQMQSVAIDCTGTLGLADSTLIVHGEFDQYTVLDDVVWGSTKQVRRNTDSGYTDLGKTRTMKMIVYQSTIRMTRQTLSPYQDMYRRRMQRGFVWQSTDRASNALWFSYTRGNHLTSVDAVPWGEALHPRLGVEPRIPPVVPTLPPPNAHNLRLSFRCRYDTLEPVNPLEIILHFTHTEKCPKINLKPKPWYLVVNTVSMKRVSDDMNIGVFNLKMMTDRDSWCWGLSAAIPASELDKVRPVGEARTEVEVSLNGNDFRFIIESFDRTRSFGLEGYTIMGRSPSAYMDSPYANALSLTQSADSSAVQLFQDEIDRSGSDYELDWSLIDALSWNIPSGCFSYSQQSPIGAMKALVEGAGGFIYSHPKDRTISVKAKRPFAFWEAPAIDLSLTEDPLLTESTQWSTKPKYTGVYVMSEKTGLIGNIIRYGSSGGVLAPQLVDPVLTTSASLSSAGKYILAGAGEQDMTTYSMPFLDSIGLLPPSSVVEIMGVAGTWWGTVQSTELSADASKGTVLQTISLERFYGFSL